MLKQVDDVQMSVNNDIERHIELVKLPKTVLLVKKKSTITAKASLMSGTWRFSTIIIHEIILV